jgi:hypothetical protein
MKPCRPATLPPNSKPNAPNRPTACAFNFQLLCLALGVNFSILGNWPVVQLVWLVPALALIALGAAGSLLAAQSMIGAFLVGPDALAYLQAQVTQSGLEDGMFG